MARFAGLDRRLDPYASESNVERAREIVVEARRGHGRSYSPGLSVVVLSRNAPQLLESVITGFVTAKPAFDEIQVGLELIVGDTGSTDPRTLRLMTEAADAGVNVISGLEYQFSENNNELFSHVQRATTLFMNNDVLLARNPGSLRVAYDAHVRSGDVVSAVLDFEDGRVQHRGVDFLRDEHLWGLSFHPGAGMPATHLISDETVWPAVTGAFLMIDSELFDRVGGFDESYVAECQDIDLCLKAHRLGVGSRVVDAGPLVHLENATRPKGEENWHDRQQFVRRWSSYIETL
ncbi:MAG: glycosyltransferase family 2 protein [Actinomycetota bacterium]